jgi:hypothetical protein
MSVWHQAAPGAFEMLRAQLRQYNPTLHASIRDGAVIVSGTYPIIDQGVVIDRYSLEIRLPDDYPSSPPLVWETAGRIPREIDRHIYPASQSLCVGYPVELWVRLRGDFSLVGFLERAVRPYLIGNSLVEEGRDWPFGQSSHGNLGALEFYRRRLDTDDPAALGRFLLDLMAGKVRGHWNCPCGSGKPIRKCHSEQVRELQAIPPAVILPSVKAMIGLLRTSVGEKSAPPPTPPA